MKLYAIFLLAAISLYAAEPTNLSEVVKSFPSNLAKKGSAPLSEDEKAEFSKWVSDWTDKPVKAEIRYDGEHTGGYVIYRHEYGNVVTHVTFLYPKEPPRNNGPKINLKPRRCKRGGGTHFRTVRGGKTVTVIGTFFYCGRPLTRCVCGKLNMFEIKINAELIR